MNVELYPTKSQRTDGPVTVNPSEKCRLTIDVPNAELRWESGVLKLILEPGTPLVVSERRRASDQ